MILRFLKQRLKKQHLIKQHLRIGYRIYLLFFDLALITLFIVDIFRSNSAWELAFKNSFNYLPELWPNVLWFLGFMLILLPLLVAFIRIVIGSNRFVTDIWLGRRLRFVWIVHIILSFVLAYLLLVARALEVLEGPALINSNVTQSFTTIFLIVTRDIISNYTSLAIISLISGSYLLSLMVDKASKEKVWIKDYILKSSLIDLNSKYYPERRRHILNVNSGALYPEISFVNERAQKLISLYNKKTPASLEASKLIQNTSEKTKALFRKIFLDHLNLKSEVVIEFYPGTTRALEVAMSEIPHPREFLVSPFEHPTINRLIQKFCDKTDESEYHPIKFESSDYYKSWPLQEEKLIDQIKMAVNSNESINAIILSEVFYATGQIIPINDLFDKLRKEIDVNRLSVLIDGSHALGNIIKPSLKFEYDAYFASAHKWLLSPKPLGILLRYKNENRSDTYDCWGANNIPLTTTDISPIAHFNSSLSLIDEMTCEYMRFRTTQLKKRLVDKLKSEFEVVGMNVDECLKSESNILSIVPKKGSWVWKNKNNLENDLYEKEIIARTVDEFDSNLPWIRVTLSYFLEIDDIDRFSRVLKSLIKRKT